jgi:exodeoxyribonuclease VII large subunit
VTLPFSETTYSVAELCGEIRAFLSEAFPSVWVAGEVQRVHESRRGHLYFELVEKGDADEIVGKLDAVLWRTDHQRIRRILTESGQSISGGVEMRCRGNVDFYPAGGRLQLIVREVDPVFSLGLLARRRQEVLAALAAEGLLERNRALPLPELPLRLALITSEGSAAYHDFLSTLRESGYPFEVLLLHASVQGKPAEREVASAFRTVTGLAASGRVELVALIRGGGSRSDLAAFDSRAIAEAVARSPVPVLTGLGHEIDESIADRVAHTALKTPTKVAELLVERVARADAAVEELARDLSRGALERLRDAREALGSAERGVELARLRLAEAHRRLDEVIRTLARLSHRRLVEEDRRCRALAERLAAAAPRRLDRAAAAPGDLARRVVTAARARLREATLRTDGLARLTRELSPQRTLHRGFSITRDGEGRAVRAASAVTEGEPLITDLADGRLRSIVTAVTTET